MEKVYEVVIERRRGPFGLIKKLVDIDKIGGEGVRKFKLGSHEIEVSYQGGCLTVETMADPVLIELAGDLSRVNFWKNRPGDFVMLYRGDPGKPILRTPRPAIAVSPLAERSQRLVFITERFRPYLTTTESLENPQFWALLNQRLAETDFGSL